MQETKKTLEKIWKGSWNVNLYQDIILSMIEFPRKNGLLTIKIEEELTDPELPYRLNVNRLRASDLLRYFGVTDELLPGINLSFSRSLNGKVSGLHGHYGEGTLSMFCDPIWNDGHDINQTFLHESRHCLGEYGSREKLKGFQSSDSFLANNYREVSRRLALSGLGVGIVGGAIVYMVIKNGLYMVAPAVVATFLVMSGMAINKYFGEVEAYDFAEKLNSFTKWQGIVKLEPV